MIRNIARVALLSTLLAACSSNGDTGATDSAPGGSTPGAPADAPSIVVTTSILGDVVRNAVGTLADVSVIMPNGASPHDFQASAQQIAELREADAVIANGAGFEEGLGDAIAAAADDGVPVYEAISAVTPLENAEGIDPHFFTDPARMSAAVSGIVGFLATTIPSLSTEALTAQGSHYAGDLDSLDASVAEQLAAVPADRRKLVTNHEVFSYFADRYGFEVIGAVVPGGGTQGEPDAAALADLADVIRTAGVPAIFVDTSSPKQLADALAAEAGDVEVVELYSESLGEDGSGADTYVGMVLTNATRIAAALAA